MKTLTRGTIIAVLISLAAGVSSAADQNDSLRVLQRELTHYLLTVEYPRGVIQTFCESIPPDMLLRLGRSGNDSVTWLEHTGACGTSRRITSPLDSVEKWAFYIGDHDGFFAIVEGDSTSGRLLCSEDTLTSLASPWLESVDLTGDLVPEIVISGFPGTGADIGMEIISWDGEICTLLTPREPTSKDGFRVNRLIGGDVRFHDVDNDGVSDIVLSVAQHGVNRKPLTYRVYRFDTVTKVFTEVPYSPEDSDGRGP